MLTLYFGVTLANLLDCADDGPWPCNEEGCPSPSMSCEELATFACATGFKDVWDQPPGDTAAYKIHERCPRACGRCNVPAPDVCNIALLDATELGEQQLAEALVASKAPVMVKGAMADWEPGKYSGILDEYHNLPVQVVVEGGTFRGEETREQPILFGDFAAAQRNGSLPGGAYLFYELGGVDARTGRFALAGPGVSPMSRRLLQALPWLSQWSGPVMRTQVAATPDANGRLILSGGSWGNGRPFHAHGPALFALLHGTKRWFIRRPNASFAWASFQVPRESLREAETLPSGWEAEMWQCSQSAGTLLWVPDLHHHATLNYHAETVGLTMVMDDLTPLTPLHVAAQAGRAADVQKLIRSGAKVDAAAGGGATALHYAAGMGHCDAASALLNSGADLQARAMTGDSPLHVAVAGGHEDAVKLLIQRGASLKATDQHGHTPAALARLLGLEALAVRLESPDASAP